MRISLQANVNATYIQCLSTYFEVCLLLAIIDMQINLT
jgi:hypothetical protein